VPDVLVHRPRTLEELHLHVEAGNPVMGGGTLLVPRWQREGTPAEVVTLERISVATTASGGYLGATATLAAVAEGPFPAGLRAAARRVATIPVRAQATVGGNLLGWGPRCLLVPLLSLNARARVLGGAGGVIVDLALERAVGERRVLVGVEWRPPLHSTYRRSQRARIGPPEHAVAGALVARSRAVLLRVAVWRAGTVRSASVPAGGNGVLADLVEQLGGVEAWQRHELAEVVAELEDSR